MRTFQYNAKVAQWRAVIEEVRDEEGLTANQVPTALVLALIHVESSGDENARRRNPGGNLSQFCGLLQIGNSLAADVGARNTDFLGDGRGSIRAFLAWAKMYASRLEYDDELLALGWKAGIGTVGEYKRRKASGESEAELFAWLKADRWGADLYVQYFRRAFAIWKVYQ